MINVLRQCRHGRMLFNSNDTGVGRALDLEGEWYQSELDFMEPFIAEGDIVIDVGANIGTHTVFFARKVGMSGVVISFEPQLYCFELLCSNIALNDLFNVVPQYAAVGSCTGQVRVKILDPFMSQNFGGLHIGGEEGMEVRMLPLDALGLTRCRLIKIDVEGMEEKVIDGARDLITRCTPLLYTENNSTEKAQSLIESIKRLNYTVYEHMAPGWNPANFRGVNKNLIHGTYRESNIFCVPPGMAIHPDLRQL
jgi:FkbM family methyltransferase